ncbi:hypothetical protein TTHT_0255 [Thermotomaculum hydrothermale]|uniref:Polysaccharide biosynthesis protein n=1 Tax=Thermotomaculum hydrothermale TaxID=981385 RepID=A0A7R6PDR8_9BACT|nr:hypothetical protein [Thermotomaculum hydrothermale]BBB31879.1 hypothetical protein TTHT_0255 [Thermotomaculum hydrothermale]
MYNYAMSLFDSFFKKNVVYLSILQVLVALSFFVLIGSIAHIFPKEDVGLYGNFRGLVQVLFVLYTMAFDIALARYLGTYSKDNEAQKEVFSTVVVLFIVSSIFSTAILFLFGTFLTDRFLKNDFLMFLATVFSLFSMGIYKIVYTFYQGKKEIPKANLLQFFSYFLGNIIIAIFIITKTITSIHLIAFLIGFFQFIPVVILAKLIKENFVRKFRFKEISYFAIPRSISVFLSGLALSASVLLATYFYSYTVAADFTITSRILRIVEIVTYAFNIIFMPLIAEKVAEKDFKLLKQSLSPFQDLVIFVGLLGGFLVFSLSKFLILSWLPQRFYPSIFILQIMSPGVFFYFYFVMFRSIIHSMDEKPIQTYIEFAGVLGLFITFFILYKLNLKPAISISVSVDIYFFIKAFYSFVFVNKNLKLEKNKLMWISNSFLLIVLGLLSLKLPAVSIILFLIVETALFFKHYLPILNGTRK